MANSAPLGRLANQPDDSSSTAYCLLSTFFTSNIAKLAIVGNVTFEDKTQKNTGKTSNIANIANIANFS
jgi:hypothetical protein